VTVLVDEGVLRLDVLMDETLPVGLAKRRSQTDCDWQETNQVDRLSVLLLDHPI